MSFLTDRDAVFNILTAYKCAAAREVSTMNSYDQLFSFFIENIEGFACLKNQVSDLLAIFDDALRISYGIYKDKTSETIDNPVIVESCNDCRVKVNDGATHDVAVFTSNLNEIVVEGNSTINYLLLARDTNVILLNIEDGSTVKDISIKSCERDQTKLQLINSFNTPSGITIYKEPMAIFGGYQCNPIIEV